MTGKEIADRIQKSCIPWVHGTMFSSVYTKEAKSCALGILARQAGIKGSIIRKYGEELMDFFGLGPIESSNDGQRSKAAAARAIRQELGDLGFDVCGWVCALRKAKKNLSKLRAGEMDLEDLI